MAKDVLGLRSPAQGARTWAAGESLKSFDARQQQTTEKGSYMDVKIEGKELVIRIPMQDPRPSASGKTMVVASTNGNQTTAAKVNGKPIVIGLNAYFKP